jgi:hypothetical protein
MPSFAPHDASLSAEELSRPQAKYFLYYPFILAVAALLLWIFPTDRMTGISSAIGGVVGSLMMWEYLFTNQVIRLTRVCSMGMVIGYGAGTFVSWMVLPRGKIPLAVAIGQTAPEMANGVAAALMSCAIMLLIGEFLEKPVLTTAQPMVITQGIKRVLQINTVVIVLAFLAGQFHQGGVKAASTHHVGILATFLEFLLGPTAVLVAIAFLAEESKTQKRVYGVVVIFMGILLLSQGRRSIVYPVLVTVGLARYSGYRWGQFSWKRLMLIAATLAFMFFGIVIYQAFRLAGTENNNSLSAETTQVQRWAAQGRAWQLASQSTARNLQTRTLVTVFLDDLLFRTKTTTPAHGGDLILQIETAIPHALYHNKPTIVEEQYASRIFHVFYPDQANSLFTLGAIDFGVWGVLIYPVVLMLLYSLFLRFSIAVFSYEVAFYGVALFLLTAISAEHEFVMNLVSMRDVLTFAAFLYVISKIPAVRFFPNSAGETAVR